MADATTTPAPPAIVTEINTAQTSCGISSEQGRFLHRSSAVSEQTEP